jgi:hypothetical protein
VIKLRPGAEAVIKNYGSGSMPYYFIKDFEEFLQKKVMVASIHITQVMEGNIFQGI